MDAAGWFDEKDGDQEKVVAKEQGRSIDGLDVGGNEPGGNGKGGENEGEGNECGASRKGMIRGMGR